MRGSILILALALGSTSNMCGLAKSNVASRAAADRDTLSRSAYPPANELAVASGLARIDFATHVKPILQSKCQPCHFQGGAMYQKLPFDRPETIKTLGEKLFTRIKAENERRVIREFLAQ